jgi:hypothetical protein
MWFLRTESGAFAVAKRKEEELLVKAEATTNFKMVLRFIRIGILYGNKSTDSEVNIRLTLCIGTVLYVFIELRRPNSKLFLLTYNKTYHL